MTLSLESRLLVLLYKRKYAILTLGEESYAEVFRTAECTLNWHRANKGFDVLMCVPATSWSVFRQNKHLGESLHF